MKQTKICIKAKKIKLETELKILFIAESKENPEGGDEAEKERCNNQDCKKIIFS